MKKTKILLLAISMVAMAGCNSGSGQSSASRGSSSEPVRDSFTKWNDCAALTKSKAYVEDVTNPNSANFIPVKDRIATFDMDGTFVGELYPTYFEYNMLEYRVLDDPAYKDIAPEDVRQAAQNIRDFVRDGVAKIRFTWSDIWGDYFNYFGEQPFSEFILIF